MQDGACSGVFRNFGFCRKNSDYLGQTADEDAGVYMLKIGGGGRGRGTYTFICKYVIYICVCTYMYKSVYIRMFLYIHTDMYTYVHIHIHMMPIFHLCPCKNGLRREPVKEGGTHCEPQPKLHEKQPRKGRGITSVV